MSRKFYFCPILPLSLLVTIVSLCNILSSSTYARDGADWQAQGIAQDWFDLLALVPLLIVSGFLSSRRSRGGFFMLAGTLVFLCYTFLIYAFAVHFNQFFLLYCGLLGLCSYTLIALLWQTGSAEVKSWFGPTTRVGTEIAYLLIFGFLFAALWLSDIIPSMINSTLPQSIRDSGLLTNPVHVIDLSFVLPGFILTAFFLRKRHSLGFLYAPIIISFSMIMTLSIGTLIFFEYAKGLAASYAVGMVMIVLSSLSAVLFERFLRQAKRGAKFGSVK